VWPGFTGLAGIVSLAAWLYILRGRGGFWLVQDQAQSCDAPAPPRPVAAVIPARDEAAVIGPAVSSLLAQEYSGELSIFVVDDHSSDGTASVARAAADQQGASERLAVWPATPLRAGWTGKLWALSEGVRRASLLDPDYLLLTDADIVHAPDNLAQLVARAEAGGYDLVSFMVKLRCGTLPEKALIPAFVFFFLNLYPPRWIDRSDRATAGAAGGCILIRAETLTRIGGLAAIRGELIDDCALARQVKRNGGRIWSGLTSATHSIREYQSFGQIERMIARTAYTQLGYSPLLLARTLAGLTVVFLAPPLLVFAGPGWSRLAGLLAWALMALSFVPTLRFYGRSPAWAVTLPLIALFYIAATLHSAWLHWRGRGGAWKGRVAPKT